MRGSRAAQLVSIFKVPHWPSKGEGEAKLLEEEKKNLPEQQEAGNENKYFSCRGCWASSREGGGVARGLLQGPSASGKHWLFFA